MERMAREPGGYAQVLGKQTLYGWAQLRAHVGRTTDPSVTFVDWPPWPSAQKASEPGERVSLHRKYGAEPGLAFGHALVGLGRLIQRIRFDNRPDLSSRHEIQGFV